MIFTLNVIQVATSVHTVAMATHTVVGMIVFAPSATVNRLNDHHEVGVMQKSEYRRSITYG